MTTPAARRPPVPRFSCPDCGRLVAATTPYPFALLGGHGTYHYLRPHHRPQGIPCPGRAAVHGRRLALVPGGAGGRPVPPTRGARP